MKLNMFYVHLNGAKTNRLPVFGIVGGVCNFLGSVSLQQKFEAMDELVLQLSFIRKNRG